MAHGKHKVAIHNWHKGELSVQVEIFENLAEALGFIERVAAKVFRIYDESGELISKNMPFDDCGNHYA